MDRKEKFPAKTDSRELYQFEHQTVYITVWVNS